MTRVMGDTLHQHICAGTMTDTEHGLNPIPQAGLFPGNPARTVAGGKLQTRPGTKAETAPKSAMAPGAVVAPQLSHKLHKPQVSDPDCS